MTWRIACGLGSVVLLVACSDPADESTSFPTGATEPASTGDPPGTTAADTTDTTTAADTTTTAEPTTGEPMDLCPGDEPTVLEALETIFYGSVSAGPSLYESSCASGSGAESFYNVTFPTDAPFSVRVTADTFAPRFAIYEGHNACGGDELACLAEPTFQGWPVLYQTFAAGTEATIVVDTPGPADGGDFTLRLVESIYLWCDFHDDVGNEPPFVLQGDLELGGFWEDTSFASCGGQNFRDTSKTWTPDVAGTYRFTLTSLFDAVFYVADSPEFTSGSCKAELACVDDVGAGMQEVITLDLLAGQTVRMYIDGKGDQYGLWDLAVDAL